MCLLRDHELLRVRPTHRLQRRRVDRNRIVERWVRGLNLFQRHDLHQTLSLACGVWIGLRNEVDLIHATQEGFLIPCTSWLAVLLPEALRVLLETAHEHRELLGLRSMHALVNGIENLGGLIDHGDCGADRSIRPTFAHGCFGCAAKAHACLGHVLDEGHQCLRWFFVWQRHDGLIDWHAACLHQRSASRRHAEDVRVLSCASVGIQKSREVGIHSRIQQLSLCGGDGVGRVAEHMQKPEVVEPHPRNECVFHEVLARLRKLRSVLIVVPNNRQHLTAAHVDRDTVRDLEPSFFALAGVFEPNDVKLAIAFVNLAITIVWVHLVCGNALLRFHLELRRVEGDLLRGAQGDVFVDSQDLHPLHRRRSHVDAVGRTARVGQVCRSVVHNEVVRIDRLAHGSTTQWAEINLLERGAAEPKHEQHAVGVGVVFPSGAGQVMVQVFFEVVGQRVGVQRCIVVVLANLHWSVRGQQLGACVGLKPQHCLEQQGMAHLAHALDRSTVRRTRNSRELNPQPEELDALSTILDPLLAGVEVVADALQQLLGDAGQLAFADLINEVVEPTLWPFILGLSERRTVQRQRDRAIVMLNGQKVSLFIHGRFVAAFFCQLDHDVLLRRTHWWLFSREAEVGA